MRIIKNALENVNPKFQIICKVCNSELEAEFPDLRYQAGGYDQREGDSWPEYWSVQCPVCQYVQKVELTKEQALAYKAWKRSRPNEPRFGSSGWRDH